MSVLSSGRRHEAGSAEIRGAVGERDPLGLDERVQVLGGVVAERLDVEALEDVQHLERDEPLRVRRHLVHVVAAVVRRDRIDPVRLVLGEVAFVEQAVALLHVGDDRAGDRALVERVAAALGDRLSVAARFGFAKTSPGFGRVTAGQERRGGRIGRELPLGSLPTGR